jgi:predicted DCC family thiol-disulfide oxidoreductase YuxK
VLSERRSGLAESLWRAGFGAWLFVQFAFSVWPAEGALRPLGALGMLAALLLALGWRDRPAAALLAVLWFLRPLEPDPWRADWIVILLLLLQVAPPAAPYGSLAARGRADPGGSWSMPGWIVRLRFSALFAFGLYVLFPGNAFLLDEGHAPSAEDLGGGLLLAGLGAGLLALFFHERALGWAWLAFLAAAIATSFEPGKEGSREFLWLALAANFQPGWFPPRRASGRELVFYDGTCALCHGFVRFVLAEDAQGTAFRFAPLDSAALRSAIPEVERARLPDSIVVRTCEGETLVRSAALLHVLRRLGGWWRLSAELAGLVPAPLGDLAYACVAGVRKRVFGRRSQACPMLPRHLRARFEP